MYVCYVDDSGDSKHGTTLTALMIDAAHWSGVLDAWLAGRRELHSTFGVRKHAELHAVNLYKGRGTYCETPEQEAAFSRGPRSASGRIMLSHLARAQHFHVVTIAAPIVVKPEIYARLVAWLEDWAAANNEHLMIFYDGQQGLWHGEGEPTPDQHRDAWETALRDAKPYRRVHRDLDLGTRRVVEDVMMQDSRYSQLIQAADLLAYGAYHSHRETRPELWGQDPHVRDAVAAYMRTRHRWFPGSDRGVFWLGT